jgi:Uroporphyrinogen-III decarboxylase
MKETGADVIGLDWRIPLDKGWERIDHAAAVQGNLDPVLLFADWKELNRAPKTFSTVPPVVPATSSISDTGFFLKLRSTM